eukprot:2860884-Rhodomonas_salina.1
MLCKEEGARNLTEDEVMEEVAQEGLLLSESLPLPHQLALLELRVVLHARPRARQGAVDSVVGRDDAEPEIDQEHRDPDAADGERHRPDGGLVVELPGEHCAENDVEHAEDDGRPAQPLVHSLERHAPRRLLAVGPAALGRVGTEGSVEGLEGADDDNGEAEDAVRVRHVLRVLAAVHQREHEADQLQQPPDDLHSAVHLEPRALRRAVNELEAVRHRDAQREQHAPGRRHHKQVDPQRPLPLELELRHAGRQVRQVHLNHAA